MVRMQCPTQAGILSRESLNKESKGRKLLKPVEALLYLFTWSTNVCHCKVDSHGSSTMMG